MLKKIALFLILLVLFSGTVFAVLSDNSVKIFAVSTSGEGVEALLTLYTQEGSGKVWSSVSPLVGTTTQSTESTAVQLASSYSNEVEEYDYFFEIQSNASVVDGPSAGSAMALLAVSTLQDKKIPSGVAMTGTIALDGSIGRVGGVFEKAQAAKDAGIKLFLIPQGEARQVARLPSGVESISLPDYALEEWGMKVVEVSDIDEALSIAFSDIEGIDINKAAAQTHLTFIPEPIQYSEKLSDFALLTGNYIQDTRQLVEDAKTSLNTSLLSDPELISVLLNELNNAESSLQEAELLYDKNYLFSAANTVFLARVNAHLIKDLADNPSLLETDSTAFKRKLSSVDEKISAVEDSISKGIQVDKLEYFVASQQRISWARLNYKKVAETKTIVISSEPGAQESFQIEQLQNLEFAVAWTEISEMFLELSKDSRTIVYGDEFNNTAEEVLVTAEDALSAFSEDEDIARRVEAAKFNYSRNYFLASVFDSVAGVSLVNSEISMQGKSSEELFALLEEKISETDSNISSSKYEHFWANVYLDHARYFLNSAQFYKENNQGARAVQSLQSGIAVVYLAQASFQSAEVSYKQYEVLSPEQIISASPVQGSTVNLYYLLGIAAAFLLLIGVVVFVFVKVFSSKKEDVNAQLSLISSMQKDLEKKRSAGKIDQGSFELLSSEYQNQYNFLKGMRQSKSKQLVEIDRLNARISSLEQELSILSKQFRSGKVLKEDFESESRTVSEKIKNMHSVLEKEKKSLELQSKELKNISESKRLSTYKSKKSKSLKPSKTLSNIAKQKQRKKKAKK